MKQKKEHTNTLNIRFETLKEEKKSGYMQRASFMSPWYFPLSCISIFNVIRPPLNPDQEHLSTVEGILSLVTAAV